jgi:serine/threonine protein kinase
VAAGNDNLRGGGVSNFECEIDHEMSSPSAAKASPSVFPGTTISGRFRIERLLGRGAMGSVWLARHLTLDVDVAVKFIDAAFRDQSDHRGRFALEAQSAARINSPHVVSVLDFGEDGGRQYIAMEFLDGEDLATLLERSKRLSVDVTARVVTHACRGLSKAHGLGIAHRDIKPENLFLCGDGDDDDFILKILDFGVAKASERPITFTGTSVGQLVGSPAFMSPEQARGLSSIDGRSDLFSLAVVAYHCLTGIMPFRGESVPDLLVAILGVEPEPVSKLVPSLPRALDAWFERALHKDPTRRFASAKDMAHAFALAVGQQVASVSEHARSGPVLTLDHESTVVTPESLLEIGSIAPRTFGSSSSPSSSSVTASNDTALTAVAGALAQLGEISHVLGAGLVGPDMATLAHHTTTSLAPSGFGELAARAQSGLTAFENLEGSRPQALALHFEGISVLLRWVEGHVVVVVATQGVNQTVLTVNLNAAASKLQALAAENGGSAAAFKAARLLPRTPSAKPSVPDLKATSPKLKRTIVYRGRKLESDE